MTKKLPEKVEAEFFKSPSGNEPVRDWLRNDLDPETRKAIGEDIRTVQYGWPIGMPLVDSIRDGIWEVRTRFPHGIARVLFTMHEGKMVLLHGFIKKTQTTPKQDIDLAVARKKLL